ncbi:glycosyl transferase, family 2 [Acidilobus saccharovorans 345-15]|uniref:Glycosyl transferase, family 2 n=1 Tax=Acidilobus saccharovorans (strain DSM 16705 / JCM 18335 / VKM B-2471 / 345-15) TaxID=666510 RepID=D9Q192_ACIS3|nr:glycosyltransferase family 2 protein [Acidilobus saccharovorans]ADL19080.1 glycosyl transferase, family 2 [Acidilobus saccharovorans 345-15]
MTRVSVVIPTLCRPELRDLLSSLGLQRRRPDDVIIIYACETARLRPLIEDEPLPIQAYPQRGVGVTGAVNQGLESAEGEIIVIIDDDAVAPSPLLLKYEELLGRLPRAFAGACSRDILYERDRGPVKGPDDSALVKLYRRLYVANLVRPYPGLEAFARGVFVDRGLRVRHGPCIPNGDCISLPFRAVNMALRKEAVDGLRLPEDRDLGAARGFEQLLGVMLAAKGYLYAYTSGNPVYHLHHASISRSHRSEAEERAMRRYMAEALSRLNG